MVDEPAHGARPQALLCATATRWLGTARSPRAFALAGCAVHLFAPDDPLTGSSPYVACRYRLPQHADTSTWALAFADVVDKADPDFVVPCDDGAFRLLALLHGEPPRRLANARHAALAALIERSLGDPAGYLPSVDKLALPGHARAFGVPMPASIVASSPDEARAFADANGWPIVLKRNESYAGTGVTIVSQAAGLASAWKSAAAPSLATRGGAAPARLLVQQAIAGSSWYAVVVAHRGRYFGGWAARKIVAHPSPKGPATVTGHAYRADIDEHCAALVRGFGMSGIFGVEFLVDDASDRASLIEVNRRLTPGVHKDRLVGLDVVGAWLAALRGDPPAEPLRLAPGEAGIIVNFPQEWLRDPASPWLADHRVDVPWDEPALFAAMIAARPRPGK
ncbi:MAG TPA: ATP-grasp domain-containing protein [Casimicrobiaceae bacterium]